MLVYASGIWSEAQQLINEWLTVGAFQTVQIEKRPAARDCNFSGILQCTECRERLCRAQELHVAMGKKVTERIKQAAPKLWQLTGFGGLWHSGTLPGSYTGFGGGQGRQAGGQAGGKAQA